LKFLLPSIIAVLGVLAGTVVGNMLKPAPKAEAASIGMSEGPGGEDLSEDKDETDVSAPEKAKGDGKAGKGKGRKDGASGDVSYYKFSREFVVPIMEDGTVNALVILHLQLEIDSSISSSLFSMEPKLRDNIMTTLIAISHEGLLFDNLTDPESYESIRSLVLEGLKDVQTQGIENVLIVDLARQDL